MSSHQYSERVPFSIGIWGEIDSENELYKFTSSYRDEINSEEEVSYTVKNWVFVPPYKEIGDLYVDVFKKKELTIYFVDDEYDNNSYFFADDLASLEDFCKDFNLSPRDIEKNAKVYQYL